MSTPSDPNNGATPPSLHRLLTYFLKLGSVGFGGPVALMGYMKRWSRYPRQSGAGLKW